MNDGVEQEAYCVDKNVPLLALDLLACLNRKALAFLRLASIRLMLRKLCNPA